MLPALEVLLVLPALQERSRGWWAAVQMQRRPRALQVRAVWGMDWLEGLCHGKKCVLLGSWWQGFCATAWHAVMLTALDNCACLPLMAAAPRRAATAASTLTQAVHPRKRPPARRLQRTTTRRQRPWHPLQL